MKRATGLETPENNVAPFSADPAECASARAVVDGASNELAPDIAVDRAIGHMEACDNCQQFLNALCPDSKESVPPRLTDRPRTRPAALNVRSSLLSYLVQDILDRRARLEEPCTDRRPLRSSPEQQQTEPDHPGHHDDLVCQLAPGQVLRGTASRFVIKARIRFGEFTETYEAEQVVEEGGVLRRARAVVKIPRVASEMSDDTAIERLRMLKGLARVIAHDLRSVAGLKEVAQVIDCGEYVHRLRNHAADSTFVAYEFVEGQDLSTYMRQNHSVDGRFCGLKTADEFAKWARALATAVHELHNRLVIHGDICPRNVRVTPQGQAVFINVRQSIFWEVMNGISEFSRYFYRAPEGIYTPSSDLFSLGGVLYFLATGKEPIGLGAYEDEELHKQQLTLKIRQANPDLYKDDAGVADIIATCLRKDGRVQHASQLLRDIDTFWPEAAPKSIVDELRALIAPADRLDREGNRLYRSLAGVQTRALRRVLVEMTDGVFDVGGSSNDMRSAANALLGALGQGDEFVSVSLPAFWYPENIGTNDRFLSMCRNAAARGASVRRVFLFDDELSDRHLQQIVSAQLNATSDIDPTARANFLVRYLLVGAEKRRQLVASGRHFDLLVKGGDQIAMFPVYDDNDRLVTLRFRSGARHVDGLREAFEALWEKSRPLVDLRIPSRDLTDLYEGAV